jgi:DNA polymerase III subunit epsilon
MKKAFYFDTETTGLHPWHNDIIQIAVLIEINGEIKDEYVSTIKPFNIDNVQEKAIEAHGYSIKQMSEFREPKIVYDELITLLSKYVNKFNKEDKFTPIGYNVKFDCDFLNSFFKKNGDKYYGSWFNWKIVDPMYHLYTMDFRRKIALPNYKLATVCQHFGIPLTAHDALEDIKATRELILNLNL